MTPLINGLLQPLLNGIRGGDSSVWRWSGNGTSFGTVVQATLTTGSAMSWDFTAPVVSTIGNEQCMIGGIQSGWSTSKVSVLDGLFLIRRFTNVLLDGVQVFDGDPFPADADIHTISVYVPDTFTMRYLRSVGCFNNYSNNPSEGRFYTGSIGNLVLTGVTNAAEYPSGTAYWPMSTYAPDNSYRFFDSDNGVVMQLYNASAEDFTEVG